MLLVMKGTLLPRIEMIKLPGIDRAIEKGHHVSRNEEVQISRDWMDYIAWD